MPRTEANYPVNIFLDMPVGSPLAAAIRQTLPSVGDAPTHVYVDSAEEADLECSRALFEGLGGIVGLANVINMMRDWEGIGKLVQLLSAEQIERIGAALVSDLARKRTKYRH